MTVIRKVCGKFKDNGPFVEEQASSVTRGLKIRGREQRTKTYSVCVCSIWFCHCAVPAVQGLMQVLLTSAVLMVSVPGDGGDEVDAGESGHETLETVSLTSFRAVWPVPGDRGGAQWSRWAHWVNNKEFVNIVPLEWADCSRVLMIEKPSNQFTYSSPVIYTVKMLFK